MKKQIFVLLIILVGFNPFIGFSQKNSLSLGAEVACPQAEGLARYAGTGFGVSLRAERSWGRHFSGIATGGYLGFKPKDVDYISSTSEIRAIPVQVGVKYFPLDKAVAGLFLSTELGIMVMKRETIYHDFDPDFNKTYFDLGVASGIGYRFGNVESSFIVQFNLPDAGYHMYYLNFRIAYTFLKSKD